MRLTALFATALLAGGIAHAGPTPHHTGEVTTADGVIGYETFGTPTAALPVIVVNGGPGLTHAYMMMNDLWPKVATTRLVVVYDQRGLGASKRLAPGASQSLDAQVADLEALRARLKLARIGLVGDSFGGMIAMGYAVAHPDHVAKLVLSDSVSPAWKDMVHLLPDAFPDTEAADAAEMKRLGPDTDAAARASLRDHFKMIFYSPAKRDAYMAKMGDLGFDPAVGAAVSKATRSVDLTAQMQALPCPTLVITGRYDLNVAPLTAWRMAHEVPHGQFVAFEESGHLPAYEEPERYRTVLEGFLDAP
jgi:proline iminopeptidase